MQQVSPIYIIYRENLYHWEVKLSGFTGEIGDDLKNSVGFVELEMRFSKDYPFQPPFVRVGACTLTLSPIFLTIL